MLQVTAAKMPAEAESVAGYNVEYSSTGFASFFLGEYANMLFRGICKHDSNEQPLSPFLMVDGLVAKQEIQRDCIEAMHGKT